MSENGKIITRTDFLIHLWPTIRRTDCQFYLWVKYFRSVVPSLFGLWRIVTASVGWCVMTRSVILFPIFIQIIFSFCFFLADKCYFPCPGNLPGPHRLGTTVVDNLAQPNCRLVWPLMFLFFYPRWTPQSSAIALMSWEQCDPPKWWLWTIKNISQIVINQNYPLTYMKSHLPSRDVFSCVRLLQHSPG